MGNSNKTTIFAGLKEDYDKVFVESWSPYLGAILLVMVILALMMSGLIWGVFGGLKLWGDWLNNLVGLGAYLDISRQLEHPLMHRMSLMNIMLVLGAFCAALLSRQFAVSRPPRLEYVWAMVGGSLMGVGATLAGGCTTGGFFTPLLHSSPAGWAMLLGLVVGAIIGLKLLLWTLEHISWGTQAPAVTRSSVGSTALFPWISLVISLAVVSWATSWFDSENERLNGRAIIIIAGFAMGFIMHRSRLCFARSIREPLMTGEGEMTKAIIVALLVGTPLAALLFQAKVIDPYSAIPATFWMGSLLGGVLFGIGMIFAGGCASGALWRMGEGHLKLWVAVLFFAWVGSIASAIFRKSGLLKAEMNLELIEESSVGYQAYLPVMLDGWGWSIAISGTALMCWYALVRYNESSGRFTLY